jgi:hypothetical protein
MTRRPRVTRGWQDNVSAVGVAQQRSPPSPQETWHLIFGEIATLAVQ